MTHVYGWLAEQSSEDALHAERLLFVEEKPFQRITRRLLGEDSVLRQSPRQLPSPPPEGGDEVAKDEKEVTDHAFARQKFREDVLMDFAALESSIMRIQLIQSSNERERERYASEKAKILATAQAVRDNTAQLREQLTEAQRILELRKGYDALAGKILDDRKLKSRDEARADIAQLQKDIAELEVESKDADEVWETRKQGFEEFVGHGRAYLRVIKGIKDQPEDEDAMEEGEEGKHDSTTGTPRPDGLSTPLPGTRSGTPLPESGDDAPDIAQTDSYQPSKLRESDVPEADDPIVSQEKSQIDTQMDDASQPAEESAEIEDDVDEAQVVEEVMDET